MLGVSRADDANHALALDHLAVLTDGFDAAAYFHLHAPMDVQIPCEPCGHQGISGFSELAFKNTEALEPSQLTDWLELRSLAATDFIVALGSFEAVIARPSTRYEAPAASAPSGVTIRA